MSYEEVSILVKPDDIVIASACRTPMGKYNGNLSSLSAPQLGAIAINGAVERASLDPSLVDEVIMGCVISAGQGQAPARQAAIGGGLPANVGATTVNKVCGSSLKAGMFGAALIRSGDAKIVIAGGMESMSNTPLLVPRNVSYEEFQNGSKKDSLLHDGLWCAIEDQHMGTAAEFIADQYSLTRQQLDEFAFRSHQKAIQAIDSGAFSDEIIPVNVTIDNKEQLIAIDQGPRRNTTLEKLASLKPVFKEDGKVTAGNASSLTDGASAVILMKYKKAQELGIKPLAKISGYAQVALDPMWLFIAPVNAIQKLYKKKDLKQEQIDLFEINEAFASQVLADKKGLKLHKKIVNVNGGAIALGHPLGASGARILTSLIYALRKRNLKRGIASLCIGGGEAVAMCVEIMQD